MDGAPAWCGGGGFRSADVCLATPDGRQANIDIWYLRPDPWNSLSYRCDHQSSEVQKPVAAGIRGRGRYLGWCGDSSLATNNSNGAHLVHLGVGVGDGYLENL